MKKIQDRTYRKKIAVLDTSALLAGLDPLSIDEEQFTVPKVQQEIEIESTIFLRFKIAIDSGKLTVKAPSAEFLAKVRETATKMGDIYYLSETDKQVLALAIELKTAGYQSSLVTDDYSIQNVAAQMELEFVSLSTLGISRLLQWMRYCPACYKKYPSDCGIKECLICGTALKRKPISKNSISY